MIWNVLLTDTILSNIHGIFICFKDQKQTIVSVEQPLTFPDSAFDLVVDRILNQMYFFVGTIFKCNTNVMAPNGQQIAKTKSTNILKC